MFMHWKSFKPTDQKKKQRGGERDGQKEGRHSLNVIFLFLIVMSYEYY